MANENDNTILIPISADLTKLEKALAKAEKDLKSTKLDINVDSEKSIKAIDKLERKISSLSNKIIALHKKRADAEIESLSLADRAMIQKLKNREQTIKLEIQREKTKFAEINNAHKKQIESMESRHKIAYEKLKTLNKQSTNEQIAGLRLVELEQKATNSRYVLEHKKTKEQISKADKEYSKTAMGALTAGTTFGHKLVTTGMYALAGGSLYALAGGFTNLKDSIVESDKYLHMFMGVLEQSDSEAKNLQQSIFNVGKEIGGTVQGMSEAALVLGRAGVENDKLADGLKTVAMAANVSGDSIENIAEMFAAWATVYPKETIEHLGDMMATIANKSLLSIDGLKTATSYITAAGHAAGVSADQLIELAGAWKQTGKADSIVGTEVRRLFNQIESGSEDVRKAYWAMGIDLDKVNEGLKSGSEEVREATFRTFMSMVGKYDSLPPKQKQAVDKMVANLDVLDKQTVKSGFIAGKEFKTMEDAGDKASGSLEKASDKIALSYEKMWERIVVAGKEGATKFEEGFKDSFAGAGATADEFDNKIKEFSKSVNILAEVSGKAVGSGALYLSQSIEGYGKLLNIINGLVDKWNSLKRPDWFPKHEPSNQSIKGSGESNFVKNLKALYEDENIEVDKLVTKNLKKVNNKLKYIEAVTRDAGQKFYIDTQIFEIDNQLNDASKKLGLASSALDKEYEKSTFGHVAATNKANVNFRAAEKTLLSLEKMKAVFEKAKTDAINSSKKLSGADIDTGGASYVSKDKDKSVKSAANEAEKIARQELKTRLSLIEAAEKQYILDHTAMSERDKDVYHIKTLKLMEDTTAEYKSHAWATDDINTSHKNTLDAKIKLLEIDKQSTMEAMHRRENSELETKYAFDITESGKIQLAYEKEMLKIKQDSDKLAKEGKFDGSARKASEDEAKAKKEAALVALGVSRTVELTKATSELEKHTQQYNAQYASAMAISDVQASRLAFEAQIAEQKQKQNDIELEFKTQMQSKGLSATSTGDDLKEYEAKKTIKEAEIALIEKEIELSKELQEMKIGDDLIAQAEKLAGSFTGMSKGWDKAQKGILGMSKATKSYMHIQQKSFKSELKNKDDLAAGKITQAEFDEKEAQRKKEQAEAEKGAYQSLLIAMSGFFEEGSKGAKAMQAISATLGIAQGIQAIIGAWGSAPFPLNMPAVAATTAAVLPMIGQLTSLGGSSGGGGGGSISAEQQFSDTAKYESEQANFIVDRLDRQIELLESIDSGGTAAKYKVSLASSTFESDIAKMWAEFVGTSHRVKTFITDKNINYTGDALADVQSVIKALANPNSGLRPEDWEWLEMSPGKVLEYQSELEDAVNSFAINLSDVKDTVRDSAEGFKEIYDSLSGTNFYEMRDLNNAYSELGNSIVGNSKDSMLSYISNAISQMELLGENYLSTTKDILKSGTVDEQVSSLKELSNAFNKTFNDSTEEALNFLDAIELVSENMAMIADERRGLQEQFDLLVGVTTQRELDLSSLYESNRALQTAIWNEQDRQEAATKAAEEAKKLAEDAERARQDALQKELDAIKTLDKYAKTLLDAANELRYGTASGAMTLDKLSATIDSTMADTMSKVMANVDIGENVSTLNSLLSQYSNMAKGSFSTQADYDFAMLQLAMRTEQLSSYATKGFSSGGYTGDISINSVAGVVHGKEYVVNAQTTKDLGLNNSAGVFQELLNEVRSLKQLNVKLVSDNAKMLQVDRAILSYQEGVA